jgi:hypothetical protein
MLIFADIAYNRTSSNDAALVLVSSSKGLVISLTFYTIDGIRYGVPPRLLSLLPLRTSLLLVYP